MLKHSFFFVHLGGVTIRVSVSVTHSLPRILRANKKDNVIMSKKYKFHICISQKNQRNTKTSENTSCICEDVCVTMTCHPGREPANNADNATVCAHLKRHSGEKQEGEPTMQTMSLPMPPFVPKICQNRLQTKHPDRKSRCQSRQICSISMFCLSPRFFCH